MSKSRRRIFLVEDEMTIALMIEAMVEDLGYEMAGMSMRLEPGLRLAETIDADLAILDINLDGEKSFPIADVLQRRGIPFFFASGYGSQGLDDNYRSAYTLRKPFLPIDLERAMQRATA